MKLISWNVTKECDLSCRHCYRDAGKRAEGELTTNEARDLLREIKKARFNLVIFSGGEPLLRSDIYELIAYANKIGLISSLGTNGLLLNPEVAKKLKNLKLSSAGISIDSSEPAYHDTLRKSCGSWQRAVDAAGNCRAAGLVFQIHTTLTRENYLDIPKLIRLSAGLGAAAHYFFFLVPCGRASQIKDAALSPEEHERALKLIMGERNKSGIYPAPQKATPVNSAPTRRGGIKAWCGVYLRPVCAPQFVRFSHNNGNIYDIQKGCLAGREYCLIGPQGDVYPCPYLPLEIGNVRKERFSKIWKESPVFSALRGNNLKGKCAKCEFAFYCRGCRANSYYYKKDILEADPQCNYQPDSFLDEFDKRLIAELQENFPLVLKPFEKLAKRLGLEEEEVLFRISRLKSIGIIKRIGPIYNPEKLGYKRTLVAMAVPDEKLKETVNAINNFKEVTHNYLRQDERFNLWFTLICPSWKRINSIIGQIRQKSGVGEIISLPTVKTIKVKAVFKTL